MKRTQHTAAFVAGTILAIAIGISFIPSKTVMYQASEVEAQATTTEPTATTTDQKTEEVTRPEIKPRDITQRQEAWLAQLIQCESSGNPEAINEVDLDGTPSYGLLQFKPSTFAYFTEAYGLPESDLMDPEAQKEIVRQMMYDPSVVWENQFPACVRKLGRPPKEKVICTEHCPLIDPNVLE